MTKEPLWSRDPVSYTHLDVYKRQEPLNVFVTTPEIGEKEAVVNVDAVITGTDIEEAVDYRCEILDAGGKVVGKVEKTMQVCGKQKENVQLTVENPSLWDLEHPYLYTYRITVSKDGEVTDQAEDTFGIRQIEVCLLYTSAAIKKK